MKVAFVTDMHFGYRRFDSDANSQGREAILSAARDADLLILGGDNFDTPLPRLETLAEVTSILREALSIFRSRGIGGTPIFAIHGNHDRRAKGFVHPTELLAQGGFLVNIHNKTEVWEQRGEKVAVSGMGNVPDDLAKAALSQMSCRPVPGAFNVLALHQNFAEFGFANGECLTFDDLPAGFDLYLCGHIHKTNLNGKVLDPGSTVVTQLREDEIGPRGWLLYDTAARKGQFMPVKSRQLFRSVLEFKDATPEEINRGVENEVKRLLVGEPAPFVKVMVRGTLAKGIGSSDLRFPSFGDNVQVENCLNSDNLKERIAQIKIARERKQSPREQGMEILRRKLEGTSYDLGDADKVFESLVEGTFLANIKEKIEKEG